VIFAKRTQFVVGFSGAYPSGVAAAIGLRTKAPGIKGASMATEKQIAANPNHQGYIESSDVGGSALQAWAGPLPPIKSSDP